MEKQRPKRDRRRVQKKHEIGARLKIRAREKRYRGEVKAMLRQGKFTELEDNGG